MKLLLEFVASLCTAIFAGASLYINLVEHPARMQCGTALAVAEFGPSYRRATVMQASLAVVGLVAAMGAWWLRAGTVWLVAGILLGAVVPFTLFVIFPTNNQLLDPALDPDSDKARGLLKKWGWLHAVRTLLSLAALVILLGAGAVAAEKRDVRLAKEEDLRATLEMFRAEISQYTLDKQKGPQALEDLKATGYFREIPKDPITGEANWIVDQELIMDGDQLEPGIMSVHSASNEVSTDGTPYRSW